MAYGTSPFGEGQKTQLEAPGISIPIDVREQYLGRTGGKTAVKFVLSVSKGDLRGAGNVQPRVYSFFLAGDVTDERGQAVESFRVPVDIDLSTTDVTNASKPVAISFLRALGPGALNIQFRLEGVAGRLLGTRAISLPVPPMASEVPAEDAGADGAGLPSAAAVILENENRPAVPPGASGFLKILAPEQEVPVGLLRIECEVKEPVRRVEFYLEDNKILVRNSAPYTVELDLGKIPKKQTLKVLGYDAQIGRAH